MLMPLQDRYIEFLLFFKGTPLKTQMDMHSSWRMLNRWSVITENSDTDETRHGFGKIRHHSELEADPRHIDYNNNLTSKIKTDSVRSNQYLYSNFLDQFYDYTCMYKCM